MPSWKKGVLAAAAALTTMGVSLEAQALALGAATVRSSLGEPLRAEIEIPQISSEEAATFSARMASPQAFQNAGVEYNSALSGARVSLQRRSNGQAYLRITSDRAINEPFLGIVIEADWNGGNLVRDYTMLVDPPKSPEPVKEAQTSTPARSTAGVTRPAVAEQVTPSSSARQRRSASRRGSAEAAPTGGGGQVTVRRGNTAYGIASANAVDGVSLDQMLVAMLRHNPKAFINGNVNLIRAGAVIHMPTAEQAAAVSRKEARRTIVAQTRDFNAYRRGLASRVGATKMASAGQRASGGVQSQVRDARPAATADDQLLISRGGTAPSGAESQMARSRQAQEQADRAAELNRNIAELARLQGASAPGASTGSTLPSIDLPTGTVAPTPAPEAPVAPAAPEAPVAPASAEQAPSTAVAQAPSTAVADVASAASEVSAMITPVASEPESAPPAAEPAPAPAPKPRPAVVVEEPEEPSFVEGLLSNPLLPIGGLGLLAALGGLGYYKMRKGKKNEASLDSAFIESRLQPDSFFGSSGGQRVNTKEDTGNLSMSYSPSQLDAAGDVDPVAEADVYLAYGRDLQAEEILREALHTQPDRVSIHRKLAEIYAKRRDARAFEGIAVEAHRITHGEGADWKAITEIGAELDPTNQLYQPGGSPAAVRAPAPAPAAPRANFGADTQPQTSQIISQQPADAAADALDLDLDLGLNDAPVHAAPAPVAAPSPAPAAAAAAAAATVAAVVPPAQEPAPDLDAPLDFSLDMDFSAPPAAAPVAAAPAPTPAPAADMDMLDFDIDALAVNPDSRAPAEQNTQQPDDADDDPLATKLSLAQEFHAIGDTDGARALVKEVIAEGSGALRARAERFLAELG